MPLDKKSLEELFRKLEPEVTTYMNRYDGGHDMNHIRRVYRNAHIILEGEQALHPDTQYDYYLICYAALLHDVGDKKYAAPGEDVSSMVKTFMLSRVDEPNEEWEAFAAKVQIVSTYVSFSTEKKDPEKTKEAISQFPELAIVQDADRLDAIGAVGVGRSFSFAENRHYGMQDGVDQFDVKLLRLAPIMKTETGKKLGMERHERLLAFQKWWQEEAPIPETLAFRSDGA